MQAVRGVNTKFERRRSMHQKGNVGRKENRILFFLLVVRLNKERSFLFSICFEMRVSQKIPFQMLRIFN